LLLMASDAMEHECECNHVSPRKPSATSYSLSPGIRQKRFGDLQTNPAAKGKRLTCRPRS